MFWCLFAAALAAEATLVLPAGQDAAAWMSAATLAGFRIGPAGGGREVEILSAGGGWVLVARDGRGGEKRASIAALGTAQAREDAVWLGSSLLASLPAAPAPAVAATPSPTVAAAPRPAPPAALPPRPAPTSASAAAPPPARRVAPPRSAVSPTAVPPTAGADRSPRPAEVAGPPDALPTPEAPVAPTPGAGPPPDRGSPDPGLPAPPPTADPPLAAPPAVPAAPPPASTVEVVAAAPAVEARDVAAVGDGPAAPSGDIPRRAAMRGWVAAGPAMEVHPSFSIGGGGVLDAGLRVRPGVWVGAEARWLAPRTLPAIEGSVVEGTADVALGAWWSPDLRVAPWVGGTLGASARAYGQGSRDVADFWVAVVGAEAGAVARVAGPASVALTARGALDLAETEVVVGDYDPVSLPRWALGGHFSLRLSFP